MFRRGRPVAAKPLVDTVGYPTHRSVSDMPGHASLSDMGGGPWPVWADSPRDPDTTSLPHWGGVGPERRSCTVQFCGWLPLEFFFRIFFFAVFAELLGEMHSICSFCCHY